MRLTGRDFVARLRESAIQRVALPMAPPSAMEGRLRAILSPKRGRTPMTRQASVTAILATLGVLAPLAALRPVALAADAEAAAQARSSMRPVVREVRRGLFEVAGVRIRAQAYVDHEYSDTPYRCALRIVSVPPRTDRWGLTYTDYQGVTDPDMDDIETASGGAIGEAVAKGDVQGRRAVLRPHLHQYDTYDERVTFHDLHITRPKDSMFAGLGFLTVTRPLTATTPSGITVALPVQNLGTFTKDGFAYNGPPGVTFMSAVLTPGCLPCALPKSPLYRRHHVPVAIGLMTAAPVFMNSPLDGGSQPRMTISPPGKNVTHLDSLTLIVHQRADLQDIPLALPVPVDRHLAPAFFP